MNKTERALRTIKNLNFCGICTGGDCGRCDRYIAKTEAIAALEKQTAKKTGKKNV